MGINEQGIVSMELPVKLTDEERLAVGLSLTEVLAKRDKIEAKRKVVAGLYKKRIEALDTEVKKRSDTYARGTELRPVDVEERRDIFARKVRIVRVDTGEVVNERGLTDSERQLSLETAIMGGEAKVIPLGGESARRAHSERWDKTEEQVLAQTPEEAEALRDARMGDPAPAAEVDVVAVHVSVGERTFLVEMAAQPEGGYVGICPDLEGVISEGGTVEETQANITRAIEMALEPPPVAAPRPRKRSKLGGIPAGEHVIPPPVFPDDDDDPSSVA